MGVLYMSIPKLARVMWFNIAFEGLCFEKVNRQKCFWCPRVFQNRSPRLGLVNPRSIYVFTLFGYGFSDDETIVSDLFITHGWYAVRDTVLNPDYGLEDLERYVTERKLVFWSENTVKVYYNVLHHTEDKEFPRYTKEQKTKKFTHETLLSLNGFSTFLYCFLRR